MKIYFYVCGTRRNAQLENRISFYECEAKETPKLFKAINGHFPYGYYKETVKKEDIAKVIGYGKNTVVIMERNDEKAIEIFKTHFESEMKRETERHEQTISQLQEKLITVESAIVVEEGKK